MLGIICGFLLVIGLPTAFVGVMLLIDKIEVKK